MDPGTSLVFNEYHLSLERTLDQTDRDISPDSACLVDLGLSLKAKVPFQGKENWARDGRC